jgi:hypothetical protein
MGRVILHQPVVHRTVRCAPDMSGAQASALDEQVALGKTQRSMAIIHRTVCCAPDYPVSPRPTVDFTTADQRSVVEPPRLFQLKCPSRTLKGSNTT